MSYDVGIVGGGPGGYSAAFEAAKYGLKVILFESDRLGGTCLNRGCIPTKYLTHIANIKSSAVSAREFGLRAGSVDIDFKAIQEGKKRIVSFLKKNLEDSLAKSKIDVVHGSAVIDKAGCVLCGTYEYPVNNIIIATGAKVTKPLSDGFLSSDDVLEMDYLPKTMKIVGGGTVAVEFAQMFSRLGAEVKIQIRGERLLRKWNREASLSVARLLRDEGVQIETKCDEERMKKTDAETCISAMGVQPLISGLNKDLFEIGESGGIVVDGCGMTSTSSIYAVGDVTEGSTQLAHHAMEEGRRAVRHILGYEIPAKSSRVRCIYVCPEIAEAGITEDKAKADNIPFVSAKVPLYSNSMNMIFGKKRGYIRLVAEKEKGTLIGAQMMCERASDLISELALAINAGVPVRKCSESIRPHPSFSEGLSDAFTALEERMG